MDKNWTRNPSLQNIDPAKIEMLLKLTEQGKGKSQKDLLPVSQRKTECPSLPRRRMPSSKS